MKRLVSLLLGWVLVSGIMAQEGGEQENGGGRLGNLEKSSISLMDENDFFGGLDSNYTNGFIFSYMHHEEDVKDSSGFTGFMSSLIGGGDASLGWKRFMGMETSGAVHQQWGANLVQLMCTPQSDQSTRTPIYNEHPYGGWLAYGMTIMVKTPDRTNTLDLRLGAVGRASMAHKTQEVVHQILDDPKWDGWRNQMSSEVAFLISFQRKYRLRSLETDVSDSLWSWGADVGNVYLRSEVSWYVRYGHNLPNHIVQLGWNPSEHQVSPFTEMRTPNDDWYYYGFGGVRGRAGVWDIFYNGTMFRTSRVTLNPYPFVAETFFGVAVGKGNYELAMGYTWRTKEYPSEVRGQFLGTIMFRFSF